MRQARTTAFIATAYVLHYVPFFAMHRSLYLHHYLPAYALSVMACVFFLSTLLARARHAPLKLAAVYAVMAVGAYGIAYTFWHFREIVYGLPVPTDTLTAAKRWVSTWDWP
jgi:dolichyl-phosphate-mannose-protein mannosyltransferase